MKRLSVLVFLVFADCILGLRRSSQCGVPLSRGKIVGGVDSGGYHYPWFALLLLKKNSYLPVPVCAGSLITRFHVLTAAHCFTISPSTHNRDLFSVALGVYDICSDSESTRQIFNVEDVIVHEKYQKRGKFYDIALLKLDRPADYTFICLPVLGVPDITEVAVIIGFGVTGENSGFVPCHLLEVNITKYSRKDCSKTELPSEDKNEASVICAGALTGEVDSCYGDSGGPLQTVNSDGSYVIVGIVSYGYGCGAPGVPGVYTNVGSYIKWINSKITILGFTESPNSTKKQFASDSVNFRKRIRNKPTFELQHPEPRSTPSSRRGGRFSTKRLRNNSSVYYEKNENQRDNRIKGSESNSSVKFPE